MGGETIVHILENCPWRAQAHLILQPMTKLPVLRQWLAKNGFDWTEQVVSEGGKFYVVLDVQSAAAPQPLTLLEQELGRIDWQEPCASAYASWKLKRFQKLAQQLKQAGVPEYSLWESLAEETAANLGRNPR